MAEAFFDFISPCEYPRNRAGLEGCAVEHLVGGKRLVDVFPDGIRALCVYNPFYGPVVVQMESYFVFCGKKDCWLHGWKDNV